MSHAGKEAWEQKRAIPGRPPSRTLKGTTHFTHVLDPHDSQATGHVGSGEGVKQGQGFFGSSRDVYNAVFSATRGFQPLVQGDP